MIEERGKPGKQNDPVHRRPRMEEAEGAIRTSGERARERVRDGAERAADAVEDAAERVRTTARRTGDLLSTRSAVPAFIRDRPVAALGVAFGAGLLLGLGRDPGDRSWITRKAIKKIRGAVISGLSAAVLQELRALVEPDHPPPSSRR